MMIFTNLNQFDPGKHVVVSHWSRVVEAVQMRDSSMCPRWIWFSIFLKTAPYLELCIMVKYIGDISIFSNSNFIKIAKYI